MSYEQESETTGALCASHTWGSVWVSERAKTTLSLEPQPTTATVLVSEPLQTHIVVAAATEYADQPPIAHLSCDGLTVDFEHRMDDNCNVIRLACFGETATTAKAEMLEMICVLSAAALKNQLEFDCAQSIHNVARQQRLQTGLGSLVFSASFLGGFIGHQPTVGVIGAGVGLLGGLAHRSTINQRVKETFTRRANACMQIFDQRAHHYGQAIKHELAHDLGIDY